MSPRKNTKLARAYYTLSQPGSYGGLQALKRVTKAKDADLKTWLSHQDAYTLHRPVRRSFPRRRVVVGGIDSQWQADLIDVQRLKKENDGFAFLLTVIDVLSKFAWIVPLKNKTGSTLVKAFETIFLQGRKPHKLQTDKGTEFLNKTFQKFLKEEGVDFFTTENEDIKASIIERFNRTIRDKLWRYFTKTNTLRYLEALPKVLDSYNNTFHRSIKTAPVHVNTSNQEEIWQRLYGQPVSSNKKPLLSPGDRVRISKARRQFKKGYLPSWTEELFTISRWAKTTPWTYVLKDDHGEELKGTFYPQEIQKVGEKQVYRIEAVLKQRSNGKEYLCKWYGYPASFNSWIPRSSLAKYTD